MASISGTSGSSSISSIYGTRNVFSGLASGMDTESMIENAVSGIKLKIQNLQKKRTKVEWQQEAYRSIIDKMANFTQKYTSYSSSTNLLSNSFFSSAVKTTTGGTYADRISATGRSSSDVQVLGVKQLATAASYRVSSLGGAADSQDVTGETLDLNAILPQSNVAGSLTLKYGGTRSVDLSFDELDIYENAGELAAGIRKKLGEVQMVTSSGETKKASQFIGVSVEGGNIVFHDLQGAGNSITVGSASGKIKDTLGIDPGAKATSLAVSGKQLVDKTSTRGDYLSGKTVDVTLDGVTKKVTLPEYEADMTGKDYLDALQGSLDKAFGQNKIKVDISKGSDADGNFSIKLDAAQTGSTLSVSGKYAEAMGLSGGGDANYVNTGKKLGDLLGDRWDAIAGENSPLKAEGEIRPVKDDDGNVTHYLDEKGNRVKQTYDGWFQVDSEGEFLYDFKVNDVSVGKFSKNSALETVMTAINSNADAGVKVSYSKMTNEFRFTASETGEVGEISFGGLGKSLFGDPGAEDNPGIYERGQDAILSMTVNGKDLGEITRSSNTFDVDGMKVTLKGTFNYAAEGVTDKDGNVTTGAGKLLPTAKNDAVTFSSSSDADKIVDAVRAMVDDYNAMVTEIKNAYSTMPATKNGSVSGSRYEPLTEEDKASMSESSVKAYEEKAKQGILFGDSNLSSLYGKLLSAVAPGGQDGQTLREIGIGTSYSDGLTTLTLDETALRSALESDPDKVTSAFTKSTESGSSTNGLMHSLLNPLNTYAKTTGEPKGVLITHAGSIKAPTTINSNTLQSQLNSIDKQIERWGDKMSSQIDRYTTQFSRLEQLIAEMNSQASALQGLMGGSSSY